MENKKHTPDTTKYSFAETQWDVKGKVESLNAILHDE